MQDTQDTTKTIVLDVLSPVWLPPTYGQRYWTEVAVQVQNVLAPRDVEPFHQWVVSDPVRTKLYVTGEQQRIHLILEFQRRVVR